MSPARSSTTADHELRRAEPGDIRAAYAVFRRSFVAHLHRLGMVDARVTTQAMLDESWAERAPWIEHLWHTTAENWVAVDPDGRVVGWAQSVERSGLLELTFFFVDPGKQSKGLGRALLERAFPLGRGNHRAIFATQDPRALSLYLRLGVRHVTTVVDFVGKPQPFSIDTDLAFERVTPAPAAVDAIASIEERLLGHRRDIDTAFMRGRRSAWIARRRGEVVGFAFGARGDSAGPIGALDPTDIPALLALVEDDAAASGLPEIYFSTPLVNAAAVQHLLGRGYRIDPFIAGVLADDLSMAFDRWIFTNPSYIL
jgi:GNAT superfamily N-acetyltransferase